MGRELHHRGCAPSDPLSFIADAMEGRRHRKRLYHARRPSHPCAEGPPAPAGHDVTFTDYLAQNLDSAKSRTAATLRDLGEEESAVETVRACGDLSEAVRDADYVVEAVLEDLPLKQKLFAEIEHNVRPDT